MVRAVVLACVFLPACSFPQFPTQCDPRAADPCGSSSICAAVGTSAGMCLSTCTLDQACPDSGESCVYITGDGLTGLVCLPSDGRNLAEGSTCDSMADCQSGLECDGSTQKCRKLCRSGGSDCPGSSCDNAFGLASFGSGAIGLCA